MSRSCGQDRAAPCPSCAPTGLVFSAAFEAAFSGEGGRAAVALPGFRLAGVAWRLLDRGQTHGRGVGGGSDCTLHVPLPLQDAPGSAARRPRGLAGYYCELDYAPNGATRETALTAVSTGMCWFQRHRSSLRP